MHAAKTRSRPKGIRTPSCTRRRHYCRDNDSRAGDTAGPAREKHTVRSRQWGVVGGERYRPRASICARAPGPDVSHCEDFFFPRSCERRRPRTRTTAQATANTRPSPHGQTISTSEGAEVRDPHLTSVVGSKLVDFLPRVVRSAARSFRDRPDYLFIPPAKGDLFRRCGLKIHDLTKITCLRFPSGCY